KRLPFMRFGSKSEIRANPWTPMQGATMPRHAAYIHALSAALVAGIVAFVAIDTARAPGRVYQATLAEANPKTPEISTEEVRHIWADGGAIVIDSRKRSEYVAGHIAGAMSPMLEPGSSPEASVAAVGRLVDGDKTKPLVLYCNGPRCQASRQLGE